MKKIIIIDYDIGNVKSIYNALFNLNVECKLSNNENEIMDSSGIILPGVGAFFQAMENLNKYNLDFIIKNYIKTNKPVLGICLGMQLLFGQSEEFGLHKGLDIIPGSVKILPQSENNYKLPNVGWNSVYHNDTNKWENTILDSVDDYSDMYFVHSYFCDPIDKSIVLSKSKYYDFEFCSSFRYGNIYGCQFHPEKSALIGLKILSNFTAIARRIYE